MALVKCTQAFFQFTALAFTATACIEAVPPGPETNNPDGPGDTLSAASVAWSGNSSARTSLVFSSDGSEIFLVTAPGTAAAGVSAIHTGTRAVRQIVSMPCCPHSLTLSRDGAWLYFVSGTASPADIDRISAAGGQDTRTTIVRARPPYALSADSRYLAVSTQSQSESTDSLIRFDVNSGSRVAALAPGEPVALSPDGTEAVTERVVFGAGSILRHERWGFDGMARGLINERSLVTSGVSTSVVQIRWDPDTMRLLLFERSSFGLSGLFLWRTIPGGAAVPVATVPLGFTNVVAGTTPAHAWSENGSDLAIWINARCLNGQPGPNCTRSLYVLHLVESGSTTARALAQIESGREPLASTFSRDGRRLAYIEAGRVFLVSVR